MPGAPGSPRKRGRRDRPAAAPARAAARGRDAGPPRAGAAPPAPRSTQLIGEKDFNSCKKFPAGKRIVKLNLKPDTELGDLISWISSITCKQFLLPGTIPANSKKVTIVAPELITPEEAYRLFLGGARFGGADRRSRRGKFLRIIETRQGEVGVHPALRRGLRRARRARAT